MKGQIVGLMTSHIIAKYMDMTALYGESNNHPIYLRDKFNRNFGFVYSASKTFDLANSYELGYGRERENNSNRRFDSMICLNFDGGHSFTAYVLSPEDIKEKIRNGKIKI